MAIATWTPETYPITFIDNTQQARDELADLATAVRVAIDTETEFSPEAEEQFLATHGYKRDLDVDGPGPMRVISIAAQYPDGSKKAFVLDMGYVVASMIADLFEGVRPFGWNANFDRGVLTRDGINVRYWWDGMLGEAVLRAGASGGDARKYTSLAKAAEKYLGYTVDGKTDTRLSYRSKAEQPKLSTDQITYAAIDAMVTLEVSVLIGAALREEGLVETFVRECNAQPFIHWMVKAGFPLRVDSYAETPAVAKAASEEAAEKIAVLTGGQEMLVSLAKWNASRNGGVLAEGEEVVEQGLSLMHDAEVFTSYLTDVEATAKDLIAQIAETLGATGDQVEDDGAETVAYALPFDADNDTSVRVWLSKTVPHFAAAYVVASRGEGDLSALLAGSVEDAFAAGGRRRKFTKDHDVENVLALMAAAPVADVHQVLCEVATKLLRLRRFLRILDTYQVPSQGDQTRLVPTWNVGAAPQVKEALNTFDPERVKAYTAKMTGNARLLESSDSVDNDSLKLIGGPICEQILEYRKHSKIVTTYGDALIGLVHPVTGRVHARYSQALVGTGRLSSFKPNAQNLSPLVKPHVAPLANPVTGMPRVLVCADLSQAELRFVSDAAQDEEMLAAFRSGEDLHERTSTLMFGVSVPALRENGEKTLADLVGVIAGIEQFAAAEPGRTAMSLRDELRQKAKRVAFGYAYGLKGQSLSEGLTVEGVPTTKEEADKLLQLFDEAYPQVAAWMAGRVSFIADQAGSMRDTYHPSGVDFALSWKLHKTHSKAHSAFNALTKKHGRTPTDDELVDQLRPNLMSEIETHLGHVPSAEEVAGLRARVAETARWALGFDHAAVLNTDGKVWTFESRTTGGRRRLFPVLTSQLVMSVITQVARSRRPEFSNLGSSWVEHWNSRQQAAVDAAAAKGGRVPTAKFASLTKTEKGKVRTMTSGELLKAFEDREMRNDFVSFCLAALAAPRQEYLWRMAMADRIRAMGNQYRNHPIQGGVADAMMVAFHRIDLDLVEKFPGAQPIQSVHDSIVIEVDADQARALRDMVVTHMQDSLASFCPTVPCVADGDIHTSLKHKLNETELDELIASAPLAPAAA